MRYDDVIIEAFDVPAEPDAGPGTSGYKVRVLLSKAGQHGMDAALPRSFDKQQIQEQLNQLADRGLDTPGMIAFGRTLADMLLPADAPPNDDSVRTLFARCRTLAGQDGGVRLRLQFASPDLARLPWEYMYLDPPGGGNQMDGFLALDPRVAIVRHESLSADEPTLAPPSDTTMKVMAAMALAADMAQLDLTTERDLLERIFGAKGVTHQFIEQSTIEDILENIADAHVFHFSGHGMFEAKAFRPRAFTGTGQLALADGRVDSEQLSLNMRGNSLRLAVLGACESGKRGGANVVNPWGSIAAMLIKTGIPAVIANQFKIADACAIAFSQAFYSGLFGGMSLERAVTAGRLAAYNADKSGRDWGVPVLYLRARDGQLFNGLADEEARHTAGAAAETLIKQRIEIIQSDGGAVLKDVRAGGNVNVVSNVSRDTVAQKFQAQNIFLGGEDKRDLTPNPPPPPRYYVNREDTEQELRKLLLADDDKLPVVVLWGSEGIGKGALAAAVVNGLFNEKLFAGGVLWGNLSSHPVGELLRDFLGALGPRWSDNDTRHDLKAARLWQVLDEREELPGDENRRTLVVVDNVQDIDQLKQLAPPRATRSRLLAISDGAFDLDSHEYHSCGPVPPFQPEHTLRLFAAIFDQSFAEKYRDTLIEIGEFYHHLPNRLSSAAQALLQSKLAPQTYLRQLEESEAQSGALGEALLQAQELVLQNLTPLQLDIFALSSIFGHGRWSINMLAAIALRPQQELQAALDVLTRRDLLAVTEGRYRLNVVFRELAQRHFAQRTPYEQEAARHLFAYAGLQAARDLQEELSWEQLTPKDTRGNTNGDFYWEFRSRLTGEMPHIRGALDWALQTKSWEIIQRFAYLSYMGLIDYLIWNCGVTYLDLSMTTISTLVIRKQADWQPASYMMLPNGIVGLSDSEGESKINFDNPADEKEILPLLKNASPDCAELYFSLMAGQVDDGAIVGADLVHGNWIGVNTGSMIWAGVDMIGIRLLACDLSLNVMLDCNATRGELQGTTLSYAILRRVKLRGANLRNVDLSGAALDDVDLRDADLTGADLTGARLDRVNLLGARLDNVRWTGVTYDKLVVGQRQQADIDEARAKPADHFTQIYQLPETRDLPNDEYPPTPARRTSEQRIDRRSANLSNVRFKNSRLPDTDLRAAYLARARFEDADLRRADLRAAWLDDALIADHTNMSGALFFAANLERARFNDAELRGASLYAANMRQVLLNDVSLRGADLFATCLAESILSQVNLRDARLVNATLYAARLYDVDLTGAVCGEGEQAEQQMIDLLKQTYCMRGCTLPDGTRYDGRFQLPGDLEEAEAARIDTNDPQAMRAFYLHRGRKRSFIELSLLQLGLQVSGKYTGQAAAALHSAQQLAELAARDDADPAELLYYCDQLTANIETLKNEGEWTVLASRLIVENRQKIIGACIRQAKQRISANQSLSASAQKRAIATIDSIGREIQRIQKLDLEELAGWFKTLIKLAPDAGGELAQVLNSQFLAVAEVRRQLRVVMIVAQVYLHFERGGVAPEQQEAAEDTIDRIHHLLLASPIDPSAFVDQLRRLQHMPDVIDFLLRNVVNIDWLAAHIADTLILLERANPSPEIQHSATTAIRQIHRLLLASPLDPQAIADVLLDLKHSAPDSAILLLNKLADPTSPFNTAAQVIAERFRAIGG
jgi:uncharacterized protein YjbI with pentapeptide repeats